MTPGAAGQDPRLTGVLRFPWFGAPRPAKLAGMAFVVAFGMLPWLFARPSDVMVFTLAAWGIAALGLFDGVTEVDTWRREVRRVLRLFFVVPLWTWRFPIRSGSRLVMGFIAPTGEDGNHSASTTLEMHDDRGRRLQLSQHTTAGVRDDPLPDGETAAIAERVSQALRLPVERETRGAHAPPRQGRDGEPQAFPLGRLAFVWSVLFLVFVSVDMAMRAAGPRFGVERLVDTLWRWLPGFAFVMALLVLACVLAGLKRRDRRRRLDRDR